MERRRERGMGRARARAPRGRVAWLLVGLGVLAAAAGCGRDERPTAPAAAPEAGAGQAAPGETADADAPAGDVRVVEGALVTGETGSRYRARLEDGRIVRIDEDRSYGDGGDARVVLELEDGSLRRYAEDGRRRGLDPADPERRVDVSLAFDLDAGGEPTGGTLRVGDESRAPGDDDVRAALAHAALVVGYVSARHDGTVDWTAWPLRCQGNEPFWNLTLRGDEALWRALGEPEPVLYAGGWEEPQPDAPDARTWRGVDRDRIAIEAQIRAERCLDTMSDETPAFSHRARVVRPGRGSVDGCCRISP